MEGGLGDLYWRNKAEELRKELKGQIQFDDQVVVNAFMRYYLSPTEMDNQLTEKTSRIACLEKEIEDYKNSDTLEATNTATLYYTSEVSESSNVVSIDIAEIFDSAVVDMPSQALDFSRL